MRFVCISDTHNKHWNMKHSVPDGDVLLIAGDITSSGKLEDIFSFNNWLRQLSHKWKVTIAGNHDFCFEDKILNNNAKELLSEAIYLEDSFVEIEGIKIYGSPWTPKFYDWAFMKEDDQLEKYWSLIPEDTDVLLTHGPPYEILDLTYRNCFAGSKSLKEIIQRSKIKYHIYGHIHEAYGIKKDNNLTFINASICNETYKPINKPIIFDYTKEG